MPTDEQIKEYADKLPTIYRAILSAFPGTSPKRRAGDGLTIDTIEGYVRDEYDEERLEDIPEAIAQLSGHGFLTRDMDEYQYYSPTPLGERLIVAVTGRTPNPAGPPPLPVPVWG